MRSVDILRQIGDRAARIGKRLKSQVRRRPEQGHAANHAKKADDPTQTLPISSRFGQLLDTKGDPMPLAPPQSLKCLVPRMGFEPMLAP